MTKNWLICAAWEGRYGGASRIVVGLCLYSSRILSALSFGIRKIHLDSCLFLKGITCGPINGRNFRRLLGLFACLAFGLDLKTATSEERTTPPGSGKTSVTRPSGNWPRGIFREVTSTIPSMTRLRWYLCQCRFNEAWDVFPSLTIPDVIERVGRATYCYIEVE